MLYTIGQKEVVTVCIIVSVRFNEFSMVMLDRITWDEDKTRPEVIRAAIKLFYLKNTDEELKELRSKHRDTSIAVADETEQPL